MTLLLKLASLTGMGYAAHALTCAPCEAIGGRAGRLAGHIVGGLLVVTATTILVSELGEVRSIPRRVMLAGLLALLGVGAGVGLGHAVDATREDGE